MTAYGKYVVRKLQQFLRGALLKLINRSEGNVKVVGAIFRGNVMRAMSVIHISFLYRLTIRLKFRHSETKILANFQIIF